LSDLRSKKLLYRLTERTKDGSKTLNRHKGTVTDAYLFNNVRLFLHRPSAFGVFRCSATNSARGHFEATWLDKIWLEVTSRPLGSRKLESRQLRGRENYRKLGSRSLRGHLARENVARGHFETSSRPPGLRKLDSGPTGPTKANKTMPEYQSFYKTYNNLSRISSNQSKSL
jgi:hypothetical protein